MRRRPAAPARQTLRPGHSTFRFAQSFESVWHFLAAGQNSRDRACGTRWKNPGMNAPTSVAYRSASRAATRAAIGHAPRARHLIVNSNCYVSQLKMPERAVPPKAYPQPSSRNLITRIFPLWRSNSLAAFPRRARVDRRRTSRPDLALFAKKRLKHLQQMGFLPGPKLCERVRFMLVRQCRQLAQLRLPLRG